MARLILEYQSGDDCTWSATNTLAVEYASAEALAVDFEAAIKAAHAEKKSSCLIAGHTLNPSYFFYQDQDSSVYVDPFIGTFEEWFAQKAPRIP